MRLLFVAPNVPSAYGKGYQVRLHHQLLGLAERHQIHLIASARPGACVIPELSAALRSVTLVERGQLRIAANLLATAARHPLSVALFSERRVSRVIRNTLRSERFDLVHLQLIRSAPYLHDIHGPPIVLDLLDSSELNMRERARLAPIGVRQLLNFEAQRLRVYERNALSRATLGLVISERDRDEIHDAKNLRVNPNGVDIPDVAGPWSRDDSTIVFSGTMSYPPNADGAIWLVSAVLPLVRRQKPHVRLRIVGRAPGHAVQRLATIEGVTVTGEVPSVHEELRRAAVAVCPVRYGSGLQTKLLEAMAAGTPVVGTGMSAAGLPRPLRHHVLTADGEASFASAILALLRDPDAARARGRAALEEVRRHSWRSSLEQLEEYYMEARRVGG